jgi:hypothetical protein
VSFLSFGMFCTAIAAFCISPGSATALELPSGLVFGASFSEVQVTARSQGWDLQQTTHIPHAWSDESRGLTFYFCDQTLATVDQSLRGDLPTFVETVEELGPKWGDPQTEVFTLVPGSRLEAHVVQSHFELGQGRSVTVQIYTKDNVDTVWMRKTDSSVCE